MNKVVESLRTSYATYQLERVWCGKKSCKSCPHGPYWYAYLRVKTSRVDGVGNPIKRVQQLYIGKHFRLLKGDPGKIRGRHKKREDGTLVEISGREHDSVPEFFES
jgi:hypothetical protein